MTLFPKQYVKGLWKRNEDVAVSQSPALIEVPLEFKIAVNVNLCFK